MRIGVVVPVYNRCGLVRECLESIAAQTRPPERVVVVDDASIDGTADGVDEWIRQKDDETDDADTGVDYGGGMDDFALSYTPEENTAAVYNSTRPVDSHDDGAAHVSYNLPLPIDKLIPSDRSKKDRRRKVPMDEEDEELACQEIDLLDDDITDPFIRRQLAHVRARRKMKRQERDMY